MEASSCASVYSMTEVSSEMDEKYIAQRITALRIQKDVSEYKMSIDLGRSKGYIQNISKGKAMPSMGEFFSICEYFSITPMEFFDQESENPALDHEVYKEMRFLDDEDREMLLVFIRRLKKAK